MPKDSSREDKEVPQDRAGRNRNIWIGLAISLGVPLIILLIAGLWSLVSPTTPTERKDVVQALGVLLAAIAGLVGLFFTAQNVRTNQRTLQANFENTQRTLWLTEQGQITERFTRAIEQLGETNSNGEPKLELRLGGIYALERIAKDSPERDYSTVMEVLTAYVRQNSSIPSKETNEATDLKEPRADIKAVLDVVGRRQEDRVPEEHRVPPDFRGINLSKTILIGANLIGAYLSGADLSGTNLSGADLSAATLIGANLEGADLRAAYLRGAYLQYADLEGAALQYADLQGAQEITNKVLERQAWSLEGATMPDGSVHH